MRSSFRRWSRSCGLRIPPRLGPIFPSARRKSRPQDFKTRKLAKPFALFAAICVEVGAAVFRRRGQKMFKGETQAVEFCPCDQRVIDEIACAKNADVNASDRGAWKLRNGVDIDVERIEEDAAVRSVGARLGGALDEQRVQRVQPDTSRAACCRKRDHAREIAEIAVPPVSARAKHVKLNRQKPVPPPIPLECAERFIRRGKFHRRTSPS